MYSGRLITTLQISSRKLTKIFIGISIHAQDQSPKIESAARNHFSHLQGTGEAGDLERKSFLGSSVFYDSQSRHISVTKNKSEDISLIAGGYWSSHSVWNEDVCLLEDSGTWGEFLAIQAKEQDENTEFTIFNSTCGSWPVYFGIKDNQFSASNDPHYVAITLGYTSMSQSACMQLLTFGHIVGDTSSIEGVKVLRPGQSLFIRAGEAGLLDMRLQNRSLPKYDASQAPDINKTSKLLFEDFAMSSIAKESFDDAVVQISGGLDSRLTAGVLSRVLPNNPPAQTLNLSDKSEIEIAKKVANELGYSHSVISLDNSGLQTLREGWLLTGGQVSPLAAAGNLVSYNAAREEIQKKTLTIFGGWPGDCLIGSYVPLTKIMTSKFTTRVGLAYWLSLREDYFLTHHVYVGNALRRIQLRRRARNQLRKAVWSSSGETAAQKVSYWAMFWRQPSFSYVSPSVLTNGILQITPLLSSRYINQLMHLRGQDLFDKNFYRAMITNAYPNLAVIPYAASGRPITEAQTVPKWSGEFKSLLYFLSPGWLRSLYKEISDMLSPPPINTVENEWWTSVLTQANAPKILMFPDGEFRLSLKSSTHAQSVFLGINWTQEYLNRAKIELENEPREHLG